MSAYVVVDVEVIDAQAYESYRQQAPATIAAYGGRYIARGGATQTLEGTWPTHRFVILEFPSLSQAKTWWDSPEYRPIRAIRERAARSTLIVTEGLAPPL